MELIGIKKSMLTVLSYVSGIEGKKKRTFLICLCDCGKERKMTLNDFKKKENLSCGCERNKKSGLRNRIDGRKKLKEYAIWAAMIQRCFNKKNHSYRHYGGRGISVCKEWRNDFSAFLNDMGYKPKDLSIDRIDNNGNYEPSNCRWATSKEQNNNKRNNIKKT